MPRPVNKWREVFMEAFMGGLIVAFFAGVIAPFVSPERWADDPPVGWGFLAGFVLGGVFTLGVERGRSGH
jgi:hypothetical protein